MTGTSPNGVSENHKVEYFITGETLLTMAVSGTEHKYQSDLQ